MEWRKLAAIDWKLGVRLAGNNKELAKEMMELLVKNLPTEACLIQKLHKQKQFLHMLKEVHKLHGALCYCGFPRLKSLVATLENDLKRNMIDSLPTLLNQFDLEVNFLLKQDFTNYPIQ